MKHISFVVPVFNEEANLREFYQRLTDIMSALPYEYDLTFVDDGSKDSSAVILAELVRNDERVQAYLLSRNYGHQLALTCGLDYADGDAVITMDGDLQHPPELVPDLLRLWEDGNEIVQTIRLSTENVSFMKRFSSAVYYKLINIMSKVEITPGGSDFRLMDQKAVEAFRLYRERARFIRGLINTLGFKVAKVEFVAPPRFAGQSKYSLRKMLHFALDGITSFSNLPLRWAFYCGVFCGLCSLMVLGHVFYVKYVIDDAVPGWATMTASVLFLGGIQLVGIGILGEYIGRVFEEVIAEIASIVDGPISGEVKATTTDAEGMIAEGREIAKIHPNMVVKIPMTVEGLKAVKVLTAEGIKTNVTLIFNANQALLAARAGATYVSPFLGRLDDISTKGVDLIAEIVEMFEVAGIETEIIAASVRNPIHVTECALAGADIATVPYKVIEQMTHHPLTDQGIEKFQADYKAVFGE